MHTVSLLMINFIDSGTERDSSTVSRASENRASEDAVVSATQEVVRGRSSGTRARLRTAARHTRRLVVCVPARVHAELGMWLALHTGAFCHDTSHPLRAVS